VLASAVLADAWAILICVLCVAGVVWILWVMRHGDEERHAEDAARLFFDEHSHWPDETLEEAAAERARLAAAALPPVSTPSADGSV
jgi:hypothetical protein